MLLMKFSLNFPPCYPLIKRWIINLVAAIYWSNSNIINIGHGTQWLYLPVAGPSSWQHSVQLSANKQFQNQTLPAWPSLASPSLVTSLTAGHRIHVILLGSNQTWGLLFCCSIRQRNTIKAKQITVKTKLLLTNGLACCYFKTNLGKRKWL